MRSPLLAAALLVVACSRPGAGGVPGDGPNPTRAPVTPPPATVPVTVDVSVIEIPTLGEWGLALLALLLAGAATLRVARRERRS